MSAGALAMKILTELGKNSIRPSQDKRQAPRDIEEGEVARTEESRLLAMPRQQKRRHESLERFSRELGGNLNRLLLRLRNEPSQLVIVIPEGGVFEVRASRELFKR